MSDEPSPKTPEVQDDHLVCFCHCVPKSAILEAIRKGARSIHDLQEATYASTGCGGCEVDLLEILESEA